MIDIEEKPKIKTIDVKLWQPLVVTTQGAHLEMIKADIKEIQRQCDYFMNEVSLRDPENGIKCMGCGGRYTAKDVLYCPANSIQR